MIHVSTALLIEERIESNRIFSLRHYSIRQLLDLTVDRSQSPNERIALDESKTQVARRLIRCLSSPREDRVHQVDIER